MSEIDRFFRAQLKPRHLQLLVALDEMRNLGKVALSLHVSQPAVSLTLGELERGLGVRLFERTARGVHPTVYGECMIRQARSMLSGLAQTRDEMRALISGASGRCSVGALPAMTPALVPQALNLLKQQAPTTTVALHEGPMDVLLPALRRGGLDFIVGRLRSEALVDDGLSEKPLFDGASALVVRPGHPLARKRRLDWSTLADFAWILPPVGSLPREPLEVAFHQHGVGMPSNTVETLSTHVILAYLQSTDAIGLLSRIAALHYRELGLLSVLPLELPHLLRPIGLTWRRGAALSPAAQQFMRAIEEVSARLVQGSRRATPQTAPAKRAAHPPGVVRPPPSPPAARR
ncbi:LysR substrate-binding domain-containing protein [Hydrogenophaga sp. BPS33]|uniref:LysR substrate-binding domain-containing protein n=1 Tax=Hydrogenophaga sp. BPS33 TaxID=2651974 RepID=UPI00131F6FF7|nr:LysR substrate-binding domain-containing protein [Hydrogenophaga sp. BPS33]QHE87492.1 LysR family transcriptional regulator [Hydrogenophaga sp. BPS33]